MKYILRLSATILSVLTLVLFNTSAAVAIDEQFYSSNDILYYNPDEANLCSSDTASSATPIANLEGDDTAEMIWNFFTSEGFSAEQTAGILGNLQAESGLDPGIEEATDRADKGYGIAQWTFERRTALEAAAKRAGVATNDLAFQLTFLLQEMNNRTPNPRFSKYAAYKNEVDAMKAQTTVNDALVAFHHNFERSYLLNAANPDQAVISARGDDASSFFNTYSGRAGGATSNTSTSNCVGSSDESPAGFEEAVLSYAWPEYHSPNYFEMMPGYEKAIERAQKQGRYIGGGSRPGIDCGGFVTTLLFDSGFDKSYNHSARGGNTPIQEAWAKANWQTLGSGSSINTADLKPGDVAFSPGHTFVYVGEIAGFDSNIASASYSPSNTAWRTPMAGNESITSGNVTWYRKG